MSEMNPDGWFITAMHGIRGWFACLMCTDKDGFVEPWQSGIFSRDTCEEAKKDAIEWAESEGLPVR